MEAGSFDQIKESIKGMSLMEVSKLVKALEEELGVSAAAPVAMVAAGAGAGAAAVEEKTEFALHLESAGTEKVSVIKVVREITALGLKEAKDLVDAAPKLIKDGMPKAQAEEFKKKLESVGAKASLK